MLAHSFKAIMKGSLDIVGQPHAYTLNTIVATRVIQPSNSPSSKGCVGTLAVLTEECQKLSYSQGHTNTPSRLVIHLLVHSASRAVYRAQSSRSEKVAGWFSSWGGGLQSSTELT